MANFTPETDYLTRVAGADLSNSQYLIVKQNSSRQVVLASANTDNIAGVVDKPNTQGGNVAFYARNGSGTFKVVAGGTVAINAPLTSNASGQAVTATPVSAGAAPVTHVLGYAQEAGVAGQVIEYLPVFAII